MITEVDPPGSEHGSGPPSGWTSWGTPPDGPAGLPPLDGPTGVPPFWMDQLGYPPTPKIDHTSAIHQLASGWFSFEKRISTCFITVCVCVSAENCVKVLLRNLVELTNRLHCNSQREALMNSYEDI